MSRVIDRNANEPAMRNLTLFSVSGHPWDAQVSARKKTTCVKSLVFGLFLTHLIEINEMLYKSGLETSMAKFYIR